MKSKTPKVSVCIPTYNYAGYLSEAIESVLSQEYRDFELLIIDDCSADGTGEVVAQYQARDERVRFLRNATNLGMCGNWNLCIEEARGEYLKFLFADDKLCSSDVLGEMAAALDADGSVTLVATARSIIDGSSKKVKTQAHFPHRATLEGKKVIAACLWEQKNLIGEPSAVMFRKKAAVRGFDGRYHQLIDLEMWFHLLEQGAFHYLRRPLCAFRRHSEQQTAKNARSAQDLDDDALLYEYLDKPYIGLSKPARGVLLFNRKYQLWKACRSGRITREKFLQEVPHYREFRLLLPFYRCYRTFFRLNRSLRSIRSSLKG